MKYIFIFCFLLGIYSTKAQTKSIELKTNADGNTLLWEITGNGLAKPSYLYGTFHLLCKQDIHFSDACRQAIKNSNKIYFELDIDNPATLLGGLMLMNMKDGKKLEDFIDTVEFDRVSDYFKDSLKTPLGIFKNMKPYFLIAMLYPKMMPCQTVSGVEEGIMAIAKKDNKEIDGLETMAFQASIFDSIPYEQQAKELLHTIDSMEKSRKYFALMNKTYLQQDLKSIKEMMLDTTFGMQENQDILLYNRNKVWVIKLNEIMKKEPVFTAVGSGHLVGQEGLIQLLRNEGYSVRPIENK
ncbi:MAG TPA: TraB/GumN family protein [Ferruginibacter sp.]|nr:TraB/GumN family protein [Ferruginibacter sp.]